MCSFPWICRYLQRLGNEINGLSLVSQQREVKRGCENDFLQPLFYDKINRICCSDRRGDFMTGSPEAVLKEYFGYDSFRTGQAEVVNSLLSGHDVLAIMPTGAGKSICFQVPAWFLR